MDGRLRCPDLRRAIGTGVRRHSAGRIFALPGSPAAGAQSWAASSSPPSSSVVSSRSVPSRAGQLDRPDRGAGQPADRVTDVVEQPADDAVAALVDDQLDDRAALGVALAGADQPRLRDRDRAVLERDAGQELLEGLLGDLAVDLGDVRLVHLVRRVRHPVREVAVVGEQDQPGGVGVEPADVEEPLRTVGDVVGQGGRPSGSDIVETTPRGLLSTR